MGERSCVKWVRLYKSSSWLSHTETRHSRSVSVYSTFFFFFFKERVIFKQNYVSSGLPVYLVPCGYILFFTATPKEEAEDAQHCQKVHLNANFHQAYAILIVLTFFMWQLLSSYFLLIIFLHVTCVGSCALKRRFPSFRLRSPLPQCWRQTSLNLMWPIPTSPLRCSTCLKMSGRFNVCVIVFCSPEYIDPGAWSSLSTVLLIGGCLIWFVGVFSRIL